MVFGWSKEGLGSSSDHLQKRVRDTLKMGISLPNGINNQHKIEQISLCPNISLFQFFYYFDFILTVLLTLMRYICILHPISGHSILAPTYQTQGYGDQRPIRGCRKGWLAEHIERFWQGNWYLRSYRVTPDIRYGASLTNGQRQGGNPHFQWRRHNAFLAKSSKYSLMDCQEKKLKIVLFSLTTWQNKAQRATGPHPSPLWRI
jgi:hypothetical protein